MSYGTRNLLLLKYTGRKDIVRSIPNLSTGWRWRVSFTPGRLYPVERVAITQWIGSVRRPQSQWCFGEYNNVLLVPGLEPRLQYRKYRGPVTIPRQLNAFYWTQNKQDEDVLYKSSETQENVNCSRTTESCTMQARYCCWICTFMTRQCSARHWHGSWYNESNLTNLLAAKNLSPSTWYLKTRGPQTHRTIVLLRACPSLREKHERSAPGRVLMKLRGLTSDEAGRRQVRNEGFRDMYTSLRTV
jgi:hypothetical protein